MPKRLSWVIPEKLGGMERPGSLSRLKEDEELLDVFWCQHLFSGRVN